MSELFLAVINMSIAASWMIPAVLVLRLLLKKAPKWLTVLLWAVVALRLICPFTVESALSLIPSAQTVSPGIMTDTYPQIHTGIPVFNNSVNPIIGETFSPNPGDSINPLQVWIPVMSMIWVVGMGALALYGIISYFRLKRKVGTAVLLRDRVYQSERVASPFVLGVFRPKIYLPFAMEESDIPHVLSHEEAHISRKDHWWKPLGFAILALHWFNPLMWISYALLCRDIELACDEKVVRNLDIEGRADYSQALLHCAVGRPMILACPVAFGEVSVKDRVRSVLSYKKPAFWLLLLGVVASIVLAICFLTNPAPGTLGTLENLEFISLSEKAENTACVWVSDGFGYSRVGAISKDLLRDLAELKTSKEEVSLSRSEDRDKNHTIVLQSEKQAEPSLNSYLEGLYIHFNSDFTSVWINNNVKPTLSYRVIEPEKAREVYNYIAGYNVKSPAVQIPTISTDATDIESLKAKFPMYFDLNTSKGLEVYIWQMAESSYSCGLLPGLNRNYTKSEILALHQNSASLNEMRAIVAYYLDEGLATKEDITIIPTTMPHSSYAYIIDDSYTSKLNELFWSETSADAVIGADNFTYYSILDHYSIIDQATFDIDNDGIAEHCILTYGPTSGVFTFTFSVLDGERLEYFNVFVTEHGDLCFVLPAMSSQRYPKPILMWDGRNGTFYMDCSVEDGNIVLSCDEQEVTYWGEQGLDSPMAAIMWGHLWMMTPARTVVGNFRTYYETTDGTWYFGGQIYKHRLVITGRMPNAKADTTYVYLSNLEDISFERAMWASGLSSSLEQYFSPEEAVLVEIKTGEPTLEEISISYNRGQFTYSYIIKDAKGAILCEEKNATREPEIIRTGLDIYGLCTQAGTGRSTNYAVFYDLENGRISEPFYYVLTALREYVIYVDLQEGRHFIVVENIFDPSAYSEKYELTNPSPVAADIVTSWSYAGINNNGVSITYLSGENYTETELFIDIP